MAYISSENIKVFPSIGRDPNTDADAELMNEGNISNIIRSLCRERKSYVLSKTWTAPFEFVIYGFYFKVKDISSLSDRPLYAHITLKENTGNYQLLTISNSTASNNSLQNLDQTSQFQGVLFNNNPSGGTHTLQLLDGNGNVPATSLLHTETNEILNAGTSNYISDYFTTTSLNTTSATIGTLTVTGRVNAPGQTITASVFDGDLKGKLTTARNISLSGDISGSVGFDASKDVTINTEIGSGKVGTNELATDAVTREKILNEAINSDKIAPQGIATNNLALDAVTTDRIKDGAVTRDKVLNRAINSDKIDTQGITTDNIKNGAITLVKMAKDSVGTDNIINDAVTSEKILGGAVTEGKLAPDAVTTGKIMNNAVTTEKIGFGVTMTLTVNDKTLVISVPELKNKF